MAKKDKINERRELSLQTLKSLISLSGGMCILCGNPLTKKPDKQFTFIGEFTHLIF